MPDPPKLSIVILNHNSGKMLVECIDSVFADDIPFAFEVIVIEDQFTFIAYTVRIKM